MMTRVVAAIAALVLVGGCGGGGSASDSRCLKVDQATIDAISEEVEGGITTAAAVKSKDFENVYMVAGKIAGGDAVWATNDDPTDDTFNGAVQSADGMAAEFSTWPKGDADVTSDGVKEAVNCLP